jgi:hypothetical protein
VLLKADIFSYFQIHGVLEKLIQQEPLYNKTSSKNSNSFHEYFVLFCLKNENWKMKSESWIMMNKNWKMENEKLLKNLITKKNKKQIIFIRTFYLAPWQQRSWIFQIFSNRLLRNLFLLVFISFLSIFFIHY